MNTKKEKIKTLVLWLLFISSIALVIIRYNLTTYIDFGSPNIKVLSARYIEDMIMPSHINVKFDKYDMTSILTDRRKYYEAVKKELYLALESKSSEKKIDEKEYTDAKNNISVVVIYDGIPSQLLEKSLKLKKSVISNIGYIDEICIIPKKQELYIKTANAYHKVVIGHTVANITDRIKNTIYTKFYTKFDNMNPNKNLLLPLTFDMNMSTIRLYDLSESIKATDIARNIFEDRIDFTSSMIQKDGEYFYSYNNGQEILKLYQDTLLEYKKESVQNLQDDIEKSTAYMLSFLSKIGMQDSNVVIRSVEKIEQGSKIIYKFNLARQKEGVLISMSDNSENIQVMGDTVVYAKVYLSAICGDLDNNTLLEPTKVLNNKIEHIRTLLKAKDVIEVISEIEDISLIYRKVGLVLKPTWEYVIGDFVFYIDAVSGDIDSYAVEKN